MSVVEELRVLRIECDRLIQLAGQINSQCFSRYTVDALRELELAKCWIGSIKAAYGGTEGYEPVNDAKDIPRSTDKYHGKIALFDSHLENVNWMWADVTLLHDAFVKADQQFNFYQQDSICMELGYFTKSLRQAKFWYGYELSRLRDKAVMQKAINVVTDKEEKWFHNPKIS